MARAQGRRWHRGVLAAILVSVLLHQPTALQAACVPVIADPSRSSVIAVGPPANSSACLALVQSGLCVELAANSSLAVQGRANGTASSAGPFASYVIVQGQSALQQLRLGTGAPGRADGHAATSARAGWGPRQQEGDWARPRGRPRRTRGGGATAPIRHLHSTRPPPCACSAGAALSLSGLLLLDVPLASPAVGATTWLQPLTVLQQPGSLLNISDSVISTFCGTLDGYLPLAANQSLGNAVRHVVHHQSPAHLLGLHAQGPPRFPVLGYDASCSWRRSVRRQTACLCRCLADATRPWA